MNKIITTSYILALAILLSSCGAEPDLGASVPALSAKDVKGVDFDIKSLKGNYVLVDFWGSWCPPCLREAPALVDFVNEYSDITFADGSGFRVVSIALERGGGDRWKLVADKFGFDWPHQIVEEARFVRASDLASAWGVTDIPAKFLVSPEGEVVVVKGSFEEMKKALEGAR